MYIFLIVIHIIVCFILILTILLQAGRGGGLIDSGSDASQSVLGTQAPLLLKRITEISAIVFLITSLLLAVISGGNNRSLLNKMRMADMPAERSTAPIVPSDIADSDQDTMDVPVEEENKTEAPVADEDLFPTEDIPAGN